MASGSKQAFTLAEVLIALALLGVIAAFTIPKVLQHTQNAERTALLKESVSLLNAVLYEGMLSGDLAREGSPYYFRRLNTLKTCPAHYVDDECYPIALSSGAAPGAGLILANGVAILDIESTWSTSTCETSACPDGIIIDWNGPSPPNVEGDDAYVFIVNYGKTNYINSNPANGGVTTIEGVKPGSVGPICNAIGLQMYNTVFGTQYTLSNCL